MSLSPAAVLITLFAGAYSHVFLDSLRHREVRPFYPFSDANPLLRAVLLETLHVACLVSGAAGMLIIFAFNKKK